MDAPTTEPKRRAAVRQVLREALLVAFLGTALAFTANALSPRGLKLSQNYFLTGADVFATNRPATLISTNAPTNLFAGTPVSNAAPTLISVPRLDEKILKAVDGAQALRFFQDARRGKGLLIFVDARSEDNYQLGHIPGAYQLDPYHPDKHLPGVLPVCQAAELIVVYCSGSDCEDSELSALLLRNAGIPNPKLFVYVNGISEWTSRQHPVETGARPGGNTNNAHQ